MCRLRPVHCFYINFVCVTPSFRHDHSSQVKHYTIISMVLGKISMTVLGKNGDAENYHGGKCNVYNTSKCARLLAARTAPAADLA